MRCRPAALPRASAAETEGLTLRAAALQRLAGRRREVRRRLAPPARPPDAAARAAFNPILRISTTRSRLRPRGTVRPVSQPKIEPGLTATSAANSLRVIPSRDRSERIDSGET